MGIRVTSRDLSILAYLYEQGVATTQELSERFKLHPVTLQGRLAKLKRASLIRSERLSHGVKLLPSRMRELRLKLQIEQKDLSKLKLYSVGDAIIKTHDQESQLTHPIFWQHQLLIGEVRRVIEPYLNDGIYLSDHELRREYSRFKMDTHFSVIPDLVYRKDEINIAFEIERTLKSELTLFERMMSYEKSQFNKVLYIAQSVEIMNRITRSSKRFQKVGVALSATLNKVYTHLNGYMSLEEFLNN